uniref:Uncharacterized protein n=1 Tax=Myoviridae sp. ctpiG4 TaxID=2826698 RepID=A0A8S5N486_9CAUD|nr:MAG TPA: hypothetical protein [Myoviridae sp. ctpiG4]
MGLQSKLKRAGAGVVKDPALKEHCRRVPAHGLSR